MWNWHREKNYNCDWCDWEWCSWHTAKLTYHWTSDLYQFEDWKGNEIYLDIATMKTFLELAQDPVFDLFPNKK